MVTQRKQMPNIFKHLSQTQFQSKVKENPFKRQNYWFKQLQLLAYRKKPNIYKHISIRHNFCRTLKKIHLKDKRTNLLVQKFTIATLQKKNQIYANTF